MATPVGTVRRKIRVSMLVGGVLILSSLATLLPCQRWQGSFTAAEYRVSVTDGRGAPITGVCMDVLDDYGNVCYTQPIDESTRACSIVSDMNGKMAFHHASRKHSEFGGECRRFLFLIPVGSCTAPKYALVFSQRATAIARISFNEIDRIASTAPVTGQFRVMEISVDASTGKVSYQGLRALMGRLGSRPCDLAMHLDWELGRFK